MLGFNSVGVDTSPVAVAIAKAKLEYSDADSVINLASSILSSGTPSEVPSGEFWNLAFHQKTLLEVCRLREGLMNQGDSPEATILRAIAMGALHGPVAKGEPTYFSNQCTRTFAPKPAYSARFWKKNSMEAPLVDCLNVIKRRARRYLSKQFAQTAGAIYQANSAELDQLDLGKKFSTIITSPPYYGMRSYVPDQWLRNWFVGGLSQVEYGQPEGSIQHKSPEIFAENLAKVWNATAEVCISGAKLVCRFGGINDRDVDCRALVKSSFSGSPWQIQTIKSAGSAGHGKRQANQFGGRPSPTPVGEFDVYALLPG